MKPQSDRDLLRKAKRRLYYAENRKREQSKHREWLEKNRDRVRTEGRTWRAANPDKVRSLKRAYYLRHREEIRRKHREYYGRNREALIAKQKSRYWGDRDPIRDRKCPGPKKGLRPPAGFATLLQVQECLADPRKMWTIKGPAFMLCPECGGFWENVGRHIGSAHGMTAAQFKNKPGPDGVTPRLNTTASLTSVSLQKKRRKKSRKLGLGQHLKSGSVQTKENRRERTPSSLQSRLNQSDGMHRTGLAKRRRTLGRRSKQAAKSQRFSKQVKFGQSVDSVLPDVRKFWTILLTAKKSNPNDSDSWARQLRAAQCPDGAIAPLLSSRTAKVATIRYVAQLQRVKSRTAQNLYSLYVASRKS